MSTTPESEDDKALADLTEGIRLNPKDADGYVNRGNVYNGKGEYDKAIADFTEAIRLNPKDRDCYHNRALAYDQKGESDKAMADRNSFLRLDSQNPTPKYLPDDAKELARRSAAVGRLVFLSFPAFFLALPFGLLFAWEAGKQVKYAALPVRPVSELGRMPAGKTVRLEGRAHSEPALLMANGSALAMQEVRVEHRAAGSKSARTYYNETLPASFLLRDKTSRAAGNDLRVTTRHSDPGFSSLDAVAYSMDGTPADVKARIGTLISPAFTDYPGISYFYATYVLGKNDGHSSLEVTSLPQDSIVTVCGVVEAAASGGRRLQARYIDTRTGGEFGARAIVSSGKQGLAAVALLGFVVLVLVIDGRYYSRSRQRKRLQKEMAQN